MSFRPGFEILTELVNESPGLITIFCCMGDIVKPWVSAKAEAGAMRLVITKAMDAKMVLICFMVLLYFDSVHLKPSLV